MSDFEVAGLNLVDDTEYDDGDDVAEFSVEDVGRELKERYWAAKPWYDVQFARDVIDRFDNHLDQAREAPITDVMWESYCAYHMLDRDGFRDGSPNTSPMPAGDQGEFILTDVSHFRNLVKHKKTLITGERPDFQPQAATPDADALQQVDTARHIIGYVLDQRHMDRGLHQTVETALVLGSAYMHLRWDPYAGDTVKGIPSDVKVPGLVRTGDLVWESLTPFEVTHQRVRHYEQAQWHICRSFVSRYDLVARLLDKGDAATAHRMLDTQFTHDDYEFATPMLDQMRDDDDDTDETIPVYTMYHDRTAALPQGRMAVVSGDGLVLWDGPLPFPRAPIYRMAPGEFIGTAIPFADSWSWLALHELANATLSPIISRIDAFGNPVISVPEGSDWAVDDMSGFKIHERPSGTEAPSLIDFSNIPASLPQTYQMIVGELDRISGINSVVRGQPAQNISSGSMAALVHAQAVQYNSDDEEQYVALAENCIMGAIQLYQSMASEEMIITLAGEEGSPSIASFKADAINAIKRVTAKRTNALMRTTEWKQEAANTLLQNGLIKSPHEYLAVVETGTYNSLFTNSTRAMASVRAEHTMMLEGRVPEVGQMEPFDLHVTEHAALIGPHTSPEAKNAILKHITETMKQWTEQSAMQPAMLIARGVPVLPPSPSLQQGMAEVGGESTGQPEEPGAKPGPKPAPQQKGVDNKVKGSTQPGMPSMPKQPNGEPAAI